MNILLPANEALQLRAIKKTAVILLLMLRLDRPATAKDIADTLEIDYQTCRKLLASMQPLGLALETAAGWVAAPAARQLSTGFPQDAVESARISRFEALNSSSSSSNRDKQSYTVEEEEEQRENTALDERTSEALDALEDAGVMINEPVIKLVEKSAWITAEYVDGQVKRLTDQKKFSSGLLLRVLKDHDPLPNDESIKRRRYERSLRKYGVN
jgi:hypothetical protein